MAGCKVALRAAPRLFPCAVGSRGASTSATMVRGRGGGVSRGGAQQAAAGSPSGGDSGVWQPAAAASTAQQAPCATAEPMPRGRAGYGALAAAHGARIGQQRAEGGWQPAAVAALNDCRRGTMNGACAPAALFPGLCIDATSLWPARRCWRATSTCCTPRRSWRSGSTS